MVLTGLFAHTPFIILSAAKDLAVDEACAPFRAAARSFAPLRMTSVVIVGRSYGRSSRSLIVAHATGGCFVSEGM